MLWHEREPILKFDNADREYFLCVRWLSFCKYVPSPVVAVVVRILQLGIVQTFKRTARQVHTYIVYTICLLYLYMSTNRERKRWTNVERRARYVNAHRPHIVEPWFIQLAAFCAQYFSYMAHVANATVAAANGYWSGFEHEFCYVIISSNELGALEQFIHAEEPQFNSHTSVRTFITNIWMNSISQQLTNKQLYVKMQTIRETLLRNKNVKLAYHISVYQLADLFMAREPFINHNYEYQTDGENERREKIYSSWPMFSLCSPRLSGIGLQYPISAHGRTIFWFFFHVLYVNRFHEHSITLTHIHFCQIFQEKLQPADNWSCRLRFL